MRACGLVMQSSGALGALGSCGLGMNFAQSMRMGEQADCARSRFISCHCSASAASVKSLSKQRLAPAQGTPCVSIL